MAFDIPVGVVIRSGIHCRLPPGHMPWDTPCSSAEISELLSKGKCTVHLEKMSYFLPVVIFQSTVFALFSKPKKCVYLLCLKKYILGTYFPKYSVVEISFCQDFYNFSPQVVMCTVQYC